MRERNQKAGFARDQRLYESVVALSSDSIKKSQGLRHAVKLSRTISSPFLKYKALTYVGSMVYVARISDFRALVLMKEAVCTAKKLGACLGLEAVKEILRVAENNGFEGDIMKALKSSTNIEDMAVKAMYYWKEHPTEE